MQTAVKLEIELSSTPTDLLAEVSDYPMDRDEPRGPGGALFALPLELDVDGERLRLYSTVATFGTPLDVAASELAIETFLPADERTRAWLTKDWSPV